MAITVPTSQTVCARSNLSLPPCLPSLRPFVSPLSPLLALCLLFCPLALACNCCLAWFPLLLHRWKLLSFTVLKRMRKRVATKESVRKLGGSVSQIWFRTSFGPRSHLVRTSLKLQPVKTQPGEVLERLCNGLLLGLLLLLLLLVLLLLNYIVHFDRRCANRISTWRKIIDVWRKRCAMRLAQVLVNGVGSRRGSGQALLCTILGKPAETCLQIIIQKYLGDMCR